MRTIADYHRNAIQRLGQEVNSTPDDKVIGITPDDWVEYLVKKYGMQAIVLDDSRQTRLVEVEGERVLRRYDIFTDQGPGTVGPYTGVRVEVPVIPSSTIDVIWNETNLLRAIVRGYMTKPLRPFGKDDRGYSKSIRTSMP